MRYLLILLLAGCASDAIKLAEPRDVAVYWWRHAPDCAECFSTLTTEPDFSVCHLTALESVPDAVLGREFRRCFGYSIPRGDSWLASGSPHDYSRDLVKIVEPTSVRVSWSREAPTRDTCRNVRVVSPHGCAQVATDHTRCRIIAHEWSHDALLGHELRHCFGWKHEADLKLRSGK
jgi:hypothetical protein